MTGYTLALAAVIPLSGWAADRFGTKRIYLWSLVLFMLGSILCAAAWSAVWGLALLALAFIPALAMALGKWKRAPPAVDRAAMALE